MDNTSDSMDERNGSAIVRIKQLSSSYLSTLNEESNIFNCPHNISVVNDAGIAILLNLHARGKDRIQIGGEYRLRLRQYLVHPDEMVDGVTGEVVMGLRTVLSDGGKRAVETVSPYIPRRLRQILMSYTEERLREGIPIALVDRASKQPGRHYHDIRVLLPDEECP